MRLINYSPLVILAMPIAASAASSDLSDLATAIVQILNDGAILLITAMIMYYFYGITKHIWDAQSGKVDRGAFRKLLLQGIIILFVAVSIWGIVQVLQYTVFGSPEAANGNGSGVYSGPATTP